ncbi:threonylcarbamoyl-AMP synthase [Flavobacterium oreochromis]|uniref:L-threonylcarbamoyladenylate synthase n=1 Tax=Flavobacterium oreochromis TaxID=2906078 RepID=UPI001CE5984A|nr:L-threonylcarbamoyladenylate synthase [Flavobacterium oreochromis]QYS85687.1 threonylcarbamoyl-AMP synthase [Flavobacterium oreochromis]
MITQDINRVIKILENQGVIGLPTETVYGLGGSLFSDKAIREIYSIKNRPFENPLIVHISNKDRIVELVTLIPDEIQVLINAFSPGPITFLLPKNHKVSSLVTAGKSNVAIRIPSHPLAQELLTKLDFPLVAPSANPFQRVSPVTAQQVENYFSNEKVVVLDGGLASCGIESTIVGYEKGKVVLFREGYITLKKIENVLNDSIINKTKRKEIEAPGMYKRHYAPSCPLIIAQDIEKEVLRWKNKKIGVLLLESKTDDEKDCFVISLSKKGNTKEALSNLYNALHILENQKIDIIITHLFPNDEYGSIINERLLKASYK